MALAMQSYPEPGKFALRMGGEMKADLRKTSYVAAFVWGIGAAAAMSAVMAVARAFDLTNFSLESLLGSMAVQGNGVSAWVLGFTVHLALGGLFGLAYARAFHFSGRTGARYGSLIGLAHWLLAGVILGMLAPPASILSPGFFLMNHNAFAVAQFLAVHLLFGAIVGAGHSRAMAVAIAQRLPTRATLQRAA
jgi:hypothetical protein